MLLQGSKYTKIEPASGAIVMAIGIFLIGAVEDFPLLDIVLGKYLTLFLLIIWAFIYRALSFQFFHRDFLIPFVKHPVNSFVIGTWIAGVSVLCNALDRYFPDLLYLTRAMGILNTFLFIFFLINCIYNFKQLFFDNRGYPVQGAILLSTVGTQSIIILLTNVFFPFPVVFSQAIIILGIIFYLLGMVLIANRYIRLKGWTLADDWANTNCIIHGALSITGLAIVTTSIFSSQFVNLFWGLVFVLLVLVELIEIFRAIQRIKLYGFKKGVFTYNITQWSRNFTFGMLYTFTLVMHNNPAYSIPHSLYSFQTSFMAVWAWVVLIVLVGQGVVYLKYRLDLVHEQQQNHTLSQH